MENFESPFYLIVGLGNPGREYRFTRHNIGFMVVDQLASDLGVKMTRVQSRAIIGTAQLGEARLILAKPQTFMNLSGQAVSSLFHYYHVPLAQLLVAHDDIDLPVGTLRLRPGGGSAGQKGVASIIEKLGTQSFARIRIGVGRPPGQMQAPDYVLQDFGKEEQPVLERMIGEAASAIQVFIQKGLETAMNQYNGVIDG